MGHFGDAATIVHDGGGTATQDSQPGNPGGCQGGRDRFRPVVCVRVCSVGGLIHVCGRAVSHQTDRDRIVASAEHPPGAAGCLPRLQDRHLVIDRLRVLLRRHSSAALTGLAGVQHQATSPPVIRQFWPEGLSSSLDGNSGAAAQSPIRPPAGPVLHPRPAGRASHRRGVPAKVRDDFRDHDDADPIQLRNPWASRVGRRTGTSFTAVPVMVGGRIADSPGRLAQCRRTRTERRRGRR